MKIAKVTPICRDDKDGNSMIVNTLLAYGQYCISCATPDNNDINSMGSLVVSVLDSPAVDPRSNPGSGSALLMSEKSQAVYYISSCHMLIDKALSSDKPNGHWFEADWLHCKRDALSSNRILMVRGSQVALKHVIHDMEARTLVMELRRRAIKRWVPCGDMDRRIKIPHAAKAECGFRTTPEECLYDSGPIGPSV